MASQETESEPQETLSPGEKRYSRRLVLYKDGYVSLCIYKNVYQRKTFYDIVLARKVNGQYRRGANFKPVDLPKLKLLIDAAEEYLTHC